MQNSLELKRRTEMPRSARLLMLHALLGHSTTGAANGTKGRMQRFQESERTLSCLEFVKISSMIRALLKMRSRTGDKSCGGATKCHSLKERRKRIKSAVSGLLRVISLTQSCYRRLCHLLALTRLISALDSIKELNSSILSRRLSDLRVCLHSLEHLAI